MRRTTTAPAQYARLISFTPSANKPGRTAPDKYIGH